MNMIPLRGMLPQPATRIEPKHLSRQFFISIDLKSESPEIPNDHSLGTIKGRNPLPNLSALQLLLNVGPQSLYDDMKLGLGFHGLETGRGPRLRVQVLSWVVLGVAEDPMVLEIGLNLTIL